MAGFKDENRLHEVRDRLYARNADAVRAPRHSLTDEELRAKRKQSPRQWVSNTPDTNRPVTAGPRVDARAAMTRSGVSDVQTPNHTARSSEVLENHDSLAEEEEITTDTVTTTPPKQSRRRRYRWIILITASLVLVAGLVYAFLFGAGEISSRNITIDISAPGTIGAGEEVPIDISLRNDNPVAIVSGTLVVQFPDGSREPDEPTRTLRTSRIPLERIEPGATQEIPVRAIIFGEEGEEKEIRARLDYRVDGTNSILERNLEPILLQITSAPLSLQIDTTEQVAAGQEVDITVGINSNAPNTLSDVLISAEYPSGFEFIESDPAPVFGQNVWRIDELAAAGRTDITIRGMFTGGQSDEFAMNFSAGVPREDNRFAIGSLYATDRADFLIEQPFFNMDLAINGERGSSVAVSSGQSSIVRIQVTNTLDSAVYDVRLAARLSGNALDPDEVRVHNGFYDSASNVVRFDVTTDRDLERIAPGATRTYSFNLEPRPVGTAQIDVEVDVFARRTSDARAQEQLVGQTFSSAQYTSVVELFRTLQFDAGPFTNTGPVPPVAEEQTTYTVDLVAAAGRNDLLEGRVELSLPTYVEWLDRYQGPGTIDFNPVNQELVWSIGSIDADDTARLQFQIAFNPSRSQIGDSPVLVNTQRFRATDRFTGVVVRDQASILSTELSQEAGYPRNNGIVRSELEPGVADDEED